jgi:hypothetical protein
MPEAGRIESGPSHIVLAYVVCVYSCFISMLRRNKKYLLSIARPGHRTELNRELNAKL